MTFRKITIDNIVKYIAQSEQTQFISKQRGSKRNTITIILLPRE